MGVLLGFWLRGFVIHEDQIGPFEKIIGNSEYAYINPILDSQSLSQTTQGDILILKTNLQNSIQAKISNYEVTQVSVYFRDLNNGPWLGINEQEYYSPASLLKVPIMMAAYKIAEQDDLFLSKKVQNQVSSNGIVPEITPQKQIIKGGEYSLDDLVYRMIVYSDNDAKNLLLSQMEPRNIDKIYHDLGIAIPGIIQLEDNMSVKVYASFFRVLYNASYLSNEMSNRALKILTESEFKNGIVAGLPKNVKVAHKFGEREITNGIKQLHDCGIVYAKKNPYLLCIMTRGHDLENMSRVIKEISQTVYTSVSE